MYGYSTTAVLIFLTHPGVAYNFFDPGIFGGLVQAIIVLLLQLPSEGRASQATALEFVYWIAFGIWAYIKVRLALMSR